MSSTWRFVLFAGLIGLACLLLPDLAWAGPGGAIAKAVTKSFWGKLVLALVVLVFLPMIVFVLVREGLAVRRCRRDLRQLAVRHPEFDWLALKERMSACFLRVHSAWSRESMAEASEWMTDWYWQNQQVAHLDRWEREGLVNHCRVDKIESLRPMHVSVRLDEQGGTDGSRVVALVSAKMEDYLAERESGTVVEGSKGMRSVETVWTFLRENGRWVVSNIEESHLSLEYAAMPNEVPEARAARTV